MPWKTSSRTPSTPRSSTPRVISSSERPSINAASSARRTSTDRSDMGTFPGLLTRARLPEHPRASSAGAAPRALGADALSPGRSETSHAGHESPDPRRIASVLLPVRPREVGLLVPHVTPDAEPRPDEQPERDPA